MLRKIQDFSQFTPASNDLLKTIILWDDLRRQSSQNNFLILPLRLRLVMRSIGSHPYFKRA
jgi:hypothetical protein